MSKKRIVIMSIIVLVVYFAASFRRSVTGTGWCVTVSYRVIPIVRVNRAYLRGKLWQSQLFVFGQMVYLRWYNASTGKIFIEKTQSHFKAYDLSGALTNECYY